MAAAGYTWQQVRVISYDRNDTFSLPIKNPPLDNVLEGTPVYSGTGYVNVAGTTGGIRAIGIALTPCTYTEATGTFGADGNYGQTNITIARRGKMVNVMPTGSVWTAGATVYYDKTGVITQTKTSAVKCGYATGTREAVFSFDLVQSA